MNKQSHFLQLLILVSVTILLSGCTGYFAYQEGLDLDEEGRFGESTTKFYEAVKKDPENLEYRIHLQKSREMAAYEAIKEAEQLEADGRLQEALDAYDRAYSFDPTQDVARLKHVEIQRLIDWQQMVNEGEQLFRERKIAQARQLVSQVLNTAPDFEPALELSKRVSAVHRTMVAGQELALSSSEPITLKFKKTDIKDAFSVISRLSGITFIYDEDIRSKSFTVFLEQATFAQALELLLRLNQLEMKVLNAKTILIYPNTRDKKKQYEDQLVQIFYLSNIDAKKAVNLLRTMLTLRKVYVHEELNALVVRDTPVAINLARQMLEAADRADSEVVFELELLSVSASDEMEFGPELSQYGGQVGIVNSAGELISDTLNTTVGEAITGNLINSFNGLEGFYTLPNASFEMKKAANDTELLANPRVRVKNMEKAKVHIGTREPVITVTTTGTDQVSENVQYVDVGIKLDVEPDIQLDGTIVTKVSLEVSEGTAVDYPGINSVPLRITTTNASTVLTLKDGEQTIIGGLLRKSKKEGKTGLPFLSDIPLIGWFVSKNSDKDVKEEILLSITPHIVRKINLPSIELASIWSGGEEDLKDGPNFGSFAERFVDESEQPSIPAETRPQPSIPRAEPQEEEQLPAEESLVEALTDPAEPQIESIIDEALPEGRPEEVEEVPSEVMSGEQPGDLPEESLVVPTELPAVPQPAEPSSELAADQPEPVVEPTELPTTAPPAESPAEQVVDQAEPVEEIALPPLEIPAAATQPKLFFNGSTLVNLDETFTLTADVSEVEGLYSAPMFVTYNPEVIEFVGAEEGALLGRDGVSTIFTVSPNPSRGQLIVGYKQGVEGSGVSGSGELFQLQFKAIKAGNAKVVFERVNLRDAVGTRIDAQTETFDLEVR